MTNRFLRTTLAASAFALAACSSGDSLGPAIELTEAETADMIEAFDAIGSIGAELREVSAALRAHRLAAATGAALETFPVDETDECPVSGTYRVTGSFTYEGTSGSSNVTQRFNNCVAESLSGTEWTFNNAANIAVSGSYNPSTGVDQTTGTIKGTLSVSSSEGSGSCVMNLTFTSFSDDEGYTDTLTGTVCGQSYSETDSGTW